jgi:hypothetical protein
LVGDLLVRERFPFLEERQPAVSLSSGLLRAIQRYATATGRSRDEALVSFLEEGSKLYPDSKTTFQNLEGNLRAE